MISYYFGFPGCGKTSLAARIVYLELVKFNNYSYVYTNFECAGAQMIEVDDFADLTPRPNSLVIIDESGIDLNCRQYKNLKLSVIEYLKTHRHYHVDLIFISQTWDDTDKVVRDLSAELLCLRRLGPFTLCQRILKDWDIVDGEIKQFYAWDKRLRILNPFAKTKPFFIFLRAPYYFMFDSFHKVERKFVDRGQYMPNVSLPQRLYYSWISTAFMRLKNKNNKAA